MVIFISIFCGFPLEILMSCFLDSIFDTCIGLRCHPNNGFNLLSFICCVSTCMCLLENTHTPMQFQKYTSLSTLPLLSLHILTMFLFTWLSITQRTFTYSKYDFIKPFTYKMHKYTTKYFKFIQNGRITVNDW